MRMLFAYCVIVFFFFFFFENPETCPRGKELLPPLRNELKVLKEKVIQLRQRKRQLTQMLVFLSVALVALTGVWFMGCKELH